MIRLRQRTQHVIERFFDPKSLRMQFIYMCLETSHKFRGRGTVGVPCFSFHSYFCEVISSSQQTFQSDLMVQIVYHN